MNNQNINSLYNETLKVEHNRKNTEGNKLVNKDLFDLFIEAGYELDALSDLKHPYFLKEDTYKALSKYIEDKPLDKSRNAIIVNLNITPSLVSFSKDIVPSKVLCEMFKALEALCEKNIQKKGDIEAVSLTSSDERVLTLIIENGVQEALNVFSKNAKLIKTCAVEYLHGVRRKSFRLDDCIKSVNSEKKLKINVSSSSELQTLLHILRGVSYQIAQIHMESGIEKDEINNFLPKEMFIMSYSFVTDFEGCRDGFTSDVEDLPVGYEQQKIVTMPNPYKTKGNIVALENKFPEKLRSFNYHVYNVNNRYSELKIKEEFYTF